MNYRILGVIAGLSLYLTATATAQTAEMEIGFSSIVGSEMEWTSSPKWSCFNASEIKLQCATYDGNIQIPSISINQNDHDLLFDIHPDVHVTCIETLNAWENILIDDDRVCIYSAEVPTSTPRELTLSYLSAIETSLGRWDVNQKISSPAIFD